MKLQRGVLFIIWILCFVWSIKADSHLCGRRNISERHSRVKRVIGGKEASQNSWPWMVNFIDHKNLQQCASSIIDREWVLTAAHCFLFEAEPGPIYNNYTFIVADHTLNFTDNHEYEIKVSKVYIHPGYFIGGTVSPGDYDIALMKLSKPLNYSDQVQPICLGKKGDVFDENDTCVLSGWGNVKNKTGYHRSPLLKEVELDLVDLKVCNSNASYKGHVSDRFLCAGRKSGGIDGCFGDSGSPYQCKRDDKWIQLGIMIWGIGCAEENHYGVYTDVRVLQPFIKAIQAGPNSNLTSYAMKSLENVRPSLESRPSSNLYDLFTNKNEFSDIDLVRNFRLVPYQIKLINKTTLMDLEFVSSMFNVTLNNITLKLIITDIFGSQAKRLYIYDKSKEVVKEFNITFEEIYKSLNLTKDGFLNSKSTVIEEVRKKLYVKGHIENLKIYRDTLMAYKAGLSVVFNTSQFEKDLNKSADDLKNLEKKSLKLILVKHNQILFTKMLGVRNISSFFETGLEMLKNMTVAKVLTEYLHINLTTFASSHQLTGEEIDLVKLNKISSVSYPDDRSLYDLMMKILQFYDSCGIRYEHSRSRRKRVIGGREASKNSWPWIVNFINSNTREQYCAGSIIDRKWILTAGHCFVVGDENLALTDYTYHVGDHRLNYTDAHEYTIEASKLFIHPKYVRPADHRPGENDIAMIELKRPLTYSEYVRPLCLVEDGETFMNGTCFLSGWGNNKNKEGYHRSPVLKEAKLDFVSLEECNSNTSYNGNISDSFICAGFKKGETDGCYGDSGGPLQCDRNGSWVQIGIVSWGKQCALPNFYGVYSNVELLLPFINAMKSGPNPDLMTYYQKTLEELLPKMNERESKNLGELLTNNKAFSDFDLVRHLQSLPDQFKLLDKTTLMNLVFVSGEHNLTRNNTMLKYIVQVFLQQTDRLKMYMRSKELGEELKISFDEMVQLLNLSKEEFLDSKPEELEKAIKVALIDKLLNKITGYKNDLKTDYKDNLNISLDAMKIRQHFNMLSLEDVNTTAEKELKQILVNQNRILFTKTLTLRNISTFLNVPLPALKNMSLPAAITQVLGISVHDFISLVMLTPHQVDVIRDSKISSVPNSEEKTPYEITHALLEEKAKTNKCSDTRCAKNAKCIQNSDYSFSCHCMKGYIANGVECDTGNTIFKSEMVLNQTFTESLNNPNSSEYLNLAEKIENGLTAAIRKENSFPGFIGCQVTGFTKGSVVAQYILIFQLKETETVNASKLSQIISRAVKNGSLVIPVLSSRALVAADFCSLGLHSCHKHATCMVRNNVVTCTCNKNYHGDGRSCVDPCKQLKCPAHSYCFRGLNGNAKCICDSGYTYEEGGCESIQDLKPALIIVSCIAGTLLLLALLVCWYRYCNRNRNKSLEITPNAADRGTENVAYDTMNMDKL